MKNKALRSILAAVSFGAQAGFAQSAAFTYQGRLSDGTNLADGTFDIRFTVFGDPVLNFQVGLPRTNNAVAVSNGLFTTTVDFGQGPWDSQPRWLELAVRASGSASNFAALSPRQLVGAAPRAAHANVAGQFFGQIDNSQIPTVIARLNAHQNVTGFYTFSAQPGNPPFAVDTTVKVINLNADLLDGLDSSAFWIRGGNAGTTAGTDFVGTTDNQALEFKVNGTRALRLEPNANGAPNVIGGAAVNHVGAGVVGATIAGGGAATYFGFFYTNRVTSDFGTVGGGGGNTSSGPFATAGGGQYNTSSRSGATVGGGEYNTSSAHYATVGGGSQNTSGGPFATVGGGLYNTGSGRGATVGGGFQNTSSGDSATVSGGFENVSSNEYATVPGGAQNTAGGMLSFAAGNRAKALHDGSFVWGDSTFADIASTAPNQFAVRARGGIHLDPQTSIFCGNQTRQMLNLWGTEYGIGVQSGTLYFRTDDVPGFDRFRWYRGGVHSDAAGDPGAGGVEAMRLEPSGLYVNGTFVSSSDRNKKENFAPVDSRAVLAKVVGLPISLWNYKADPENKHIGPVAQDFHSAFGVGPDDKHIASVDADGVALAAIQGLNQKLQEELKRRDHDNAELKRRVERLEKLLSASK